MVDQLLLQLEPFRPAHRANLLKNALTESVGKGRKGLLVSGEAAAGTGDMGHAEKVTSRRCLLVTGHGLRVTV
jgi:hypothetical protein